MAETTGTSAHFLRTGLVFQRDELTLIPAVIPDGAIQILYIGSAGHTYLASQVAVSIRALRAGCPAVQLFWVGAMGIQDDLRQFFMELAMPDESFECSFSFSQFTQMLLVKRLPREEPCE